MVLFVLSGKLVKKTGHNRQEHRDCNGANVNEEAVLRVRLSTFSNIALSRWCFVSERGIASNDSECRA